MDCKMIEYKSKKIIPKITKITKIKFQLKMKKYKLS